MCCSKIVINYVINVGLNKTVVLKPTPMGFIGFGVFQLNPDLCKKAQLDGVSGFSYVFSY